MILPCICKLMGFLFGKLFWQNQKHRSGARTISHYCASLVSGAQVKFGRDGFSIFEEVEMVSPYLRKLC